MVVIECCNLNLNTYGVLHGFLILAINCPALTVGNLVKTSPGNCVTSQMKINTMCSFKCPRGYQLNGPSYKQCRAHGRWTNSNKRVSCVGEFSPLKEFTVTFCHFLTEQLHQVNQAHNYEKEINID